MKKSTKTTIIVSIIIALFLVWGFVSNAFEALYLLFFKMGPYTESSIYYNAFPADSGDAVYKIECQDYSMAIEVSTNQEHYLVGYYIADDVKTDFYIILLDRYTSYGIICDASTNTIISKCYYSREDGEEGSVLTISHYDGKEGLEVQEKFFSVLDTGIINLIKQ